MNLTKNDLRLGNIVTIDGKTLYYKVIGLSRKGAIITNGEKTITTDAMQAVPLTIQMLKLLGFSDWSGMNSKEKRLVRYNAIDGTSNFEVNIETNKGGGILFAAFSYSIDTDERMYIPNSKYLHTLQNAFYLFAGYDLGIDLKELNNLTI